MYFVGMQKVGKHRLWLTLPKVPAPGTPGCAFTTVPLCLSFQTFKSRVITAELCWRASLHLPNVVRKVLEFLRTQLRWPVLEGS